MAQRPRDRAALPGQEVVPVGFEPSLCDATTLIPKLCGFGQAAEPP